MKRIVKKNQIILTVLAVMIAVAGYLSYAGKFKLPGDESAADETLEAGLLEISDEDILAEKTHFQLSPEQWNAFTTLLDAPVHPNPALDRLLSTPAPWDK